MSINKFSLPPVFGGETKDFNADDARRGAGKNSITTRRFTNNIGKALGYIPLVGTVVGIARAVDTCFLLCDYEVSWKNLAGRVVRSGVETLSLGIIFLPVDLGVTLYRVMKSSDSSEPKPDLMNVDPRPPSDKVLHPSAAHLHEVGDESEPSTSSRASGSAKPPTTSPIKPITSPINENKNPKKKTPKRVTIAPAAPPASVDAVPQPGQPLVRLPAGPAAVLPPAAHPVAELPLAVRPGAVPPAAVDLPRGMLKSTTLVDLDRYNYPDFSTTEILDADPNFKHEYAKSKFTTSNWNHRAGMMSSSQAADKRIGEFESCLATASKAWIELQEAKASLQEAGEWKNEGEDLTEPDNSLSLPLPLNSLLLPPPPPPPPPPSSPQVNKGPQIPKQKTLARVEIREDTPMDRYNIKLIAYTVAIQTLSLELFPLHPNTIFIHKGESIDPEVENAIDFEEAPGLIDRIKNQLSAPKLPSSVQPERSVLTEDQQACSIFLEKKNGELAAAMKQFRVAEENHKNATEPYLKAKEQVVALRNLPNKTIRDLLKLDEALKEEKACLENLNKADQNKLIESYNQAQERLNLLIVDIQKITGIIDSKPSKVQTELTNFTKRIKGVDEAFLQSDQFKIILQNARALEKANAQKPASLAAVRKWGSKNK